jgi:CheY-like chemotaxis protein
MLLELMGHDVHLVYNGQDALEAVAQFKPNVALVDIGLPGMNGYDLARRIREQPRSRDILLVAQTGWGHESDRRRSREAGFDHHLVKPVAPETLQEILRTSQKR